MMNGMNEAVSINAHAKVNLALDVLSREPNGYHRLHTVMQTISLHDTVILSVGNPGIRIMCNDPAVPTDENNLMYKATLRFFGTLDMKPSIDIVLTKRIPMQAGLGGGSSDAASVLIGLNKMLGNPLGIEDLAAISAQIGSDVPFFLIGGTALVSGFGEYVEPLPDFPMTSILIVKPPFGISTAWSYNRLDEIRQQGTTALSNKTESGFMVEEIRAARWISALEYVHNDLELPSIESHPEIVGIKRALIESGAIVSLMCGSGSAVFGIYPHEESARNAAANLGRYGEVYVGNTIGRNKRFEV